MEQGLINNCPIRKRDILRAEDIFGPHIGSLKGKTTCKTPSKVIINALYNLPEGMLEEHGNFTSIKSLSLLLEFGIDKRNYEQPNSGLAHKF